MNISLIHSSRLFALVLALAIPASSAAAEPMSKVYDCDGRKMEIFEPKDGVMEARVEDLTVRISVRDGGSFSSASYSVILEGRREGELLSARHEGPKNARGRKLTQQVRTPVVVGPGA